MSCCPRGSGQNISIFLGQDEIAKIDKCNLKVVIVIFDIEVLFKRPVNKLCEEDLIAAVLVDLVELRIDVRDGANPLEMQKITLLPYKVPTVFDIC